MKYLEGKAVQGMLFKLLTADAKYYVIFGLVNF